MYVLITRNILKHYEVNTKTIKQRAVIINDVVTLMILPPKSQVIVIMEHGISISHLLDLKAALDLHITVVVNNQTDYDICEGIFPTKLLVSNMIDGELINSVILNDEKLMEAISSVSVPRRLPIHADGILDEARKLANAPNTNDTVKAVANALLNFVDTTDYKNSLTADTTEEIVRLRKRNVGLESSLSGMAEDADDFLRSYHAVQIQLAAQNVINVIKDTSVFSMPTNSSSLVIKNFGTPHLMRFVYALRDALVTSFDKYVKIVYIAEPDNVSIREIDRSKFFQLTSETKSSELLKQDLLLCVGNTKEPLEFLTKVSTTHIYILVDSRRTTEDLIANYSMKLYAVPDVDTAMNLELDLNQTITGSEKSKYTLRESDFIGRKRHAIRNNELVLRVANTLVSL